MFNYFRDICFNNIILRVIVLVIRKMQNLIKGKKLNNRTIWKAQ